MFVEGKLLKKNMFLARFSQVCWFHLSPLNRYLFLSHTLQTVNYFWIHMLVSLTCFFSSLDPCLFFDHKQICMNPAVDEIPELAGLQSPIMQLKDA